MYAIRSYYVDTHVKRVSTRLGWTKQREPEKIETDLCRLLPQAKWTLASHVLIFHGRRFCKAPIRITSYNVCYTKLLR